MLKIWRKPLHKRKIWKQMSLIKKITYYMQPFAENIFEIWLQPLPFPTIFKLLYSVVLLLILILPIVYPMIILSFYYIVVQYFIGSDLNVQFPEDFDLIHYVKVVFNSKIPNEKCEQFLISYIEKYRYIVTATASCVDYMRLALTLFIG